MNYPTIKIKSDKLSSIYRRHPWIFSGALVKVPNNLVDGTIVKIIGDTDLGIGIYFNSSIAVKIVSFDCNLSIEQIIENKIELAIKIRKDLGLVNTNCYRLINAEGDSLPGLIIDIYDNLAVIQIQNNWILPYLDLITKKLSNFKFIYNKSFKYTKLEDNFLSKDKIESIVATENNLKYYIDFINGQKTGFFLDQRDNRQIVSEISKNKEVLNICSYSGGFSISAFAGGANKVSSLDYSKSALDLAQKNFNLNFNQDHEIIQADFFKFETNTKYNMVVLDPPAFAKHRGNIREAVNGYININRKALNLVDDGYLITFSCSQVVSDIDFLYAVQQAGSLDKREIRVIKKLTQAKCHLTSLYHNEGSYLKGYVLRVC